MGCEAALHVTRQTSHVTRHTSLQVAPVKGAKELGREAKAEAKLSKKKDRTGFDFEKGKGPRADKERKIVKPLKKARDL